MRLFLEGAEDVHSWHSEVKKKDEAFPTAK